MSESTLSNPDIEAPIIPASSLGGFQLRTPIHSWSEELALLGGTGRIKYLAHTPLAMKYTTCNGAVHIFVDVRNGKVFKLSAGLGYRGPALGSLRPGMTVGDCMKAEPRLYFSEPEGIILCRDTPGISLEVSDPDPQPDSIGLQRVELISVFAPEIATRAAQVGSW